MLLRYLIFSLILILVSCSDSFEKNDTSNNTAKQIINVPIFENFEDVEDQIFKENDTLYVVNFWATTCPPCIKEMPHFNEFYHKHSAEKVKLLLVSLDMPRDIDKRVVPFVEKYGIAPDVCLLGDQNYSAWTEKIDSSWYGALPATVMIKGDQKHFKMDAFQTFEELDDMARPFLSGSLIGENLRASEE